MPQTKLDKYKGLIEYPIQVFSGKGRKLKALLRIWEGGSTHFSEDNLALYVLFSDWLRQ